MYREIAWGTPHADRKCWGFLLIYQHGDRNLRNGMSQEGVGKWERLWFIPGLKQGKEKARKATKEGEQSSSELAVSWK